MDDKRGTSPEYPDVRFLFDRWVPTGLSPEHTEDEVDRIAAERSAEEQALPPRRPWWQRLFHRTS